MSQFQAVSKSLSEIHPVILLKFLSQLLQFYSSRVVPHPFFMSFMLLFQCCIDGQLIAFGAESNNVIQHLAVNSWVWLSYSWNR